MNPPAHPAVQALLFNGVWAACVLGGASRIAWLPGAATLAFLSVHFAFVHWTPREPVRILATGVAGFAADSAFSAAGLLRFGVAANGPIIPPLWLLCLWLAFAASLGGYLSALRDRPALAALTGAAAGPLSYWAGSRLGVLSLGDRPVTSLTALTLFWAAFLPTALRLTQTGGTPAFRKERSHA